MSGELPTEPKKKTKVDLQCKEGYSVLGKTAHSAEVKANHTDAGGNFYVYDLYDTSGILIALNRYVYVDTTGQPFSKLTEEDELILNPPIEEPEEELYGK